MSKKDDRYPEELFNNLKYERQSARDRRTEMAESARPSCFAFFLG